jgi:O-methyltransferase involved in polyketide biosynthesis
MEGISMYLQPEELKEVLKAICGHFSSVDILMDSYTVFAARASKYKNPINEVGVTQVYGLNDPRELESVGIRFAGEHELTPEEMIRQLKGFEQTLFRKLYAGNMAKKLYRLYEFTGV